MSRTSIIIIIIAILIAAGLIIYYGYFDEEENGANGNQETEEEINLSELFSGLQESTPVNLVEGGDEELKWAVEEESGLKEVLITLNSLRANSVSLRDSEDIKAYLTEQGFDPISINIPLKKYAEINGYRKSNVVCIFLAGPTGYKDAPDNWTPPNPDLLDIDVRCGEMQTNAVSEVTCTMPAGDSMTLTEAKSIAQNSDCGGNFADNHICNSQSGVWWLGLNIEGEGCNPTCEVDIKTKRAELNMRCVNGAQNGP